MNAFFTTVLFKKDGTFDRSTSGHDTLDAAEQAFHQTMAGYMAKPDYIKIIAFVYDSAGVIKFRRVWERET